MIGSGIGQGYGFNRGMTLKPTSFNVGSDSAHKQNTSTSNVPVSQITLNSNIGSLAPI